MRADFDRGQEALMAEATMDVSQETPIQTFYSGPLFDPLGMRDGLSPLSGIPSHGLAPTDVDVGAFGLENSELSFVIDPDGSFFGDCIGVVDAPDEEALALGFPPFGWSGSQLLGGHALTASRLHGELSFQFGPAEGGRVPFTIAQSSPLRGDDGVLAGPDGWELPTVENEVRPALPLSHGSLDLTTGRVYDFHFNGEFWNTAIAALLRENPSLSPPPLLFPGAPHAGHALAWFAPAENGDALRFNLGAQMFLPLGPGDGAPLTMPGSASASGRQSAFPARNSSLHPFIYLSCCCGAPTAPPASRPAKARGSSSAIASLLDDHQNATTRLRCLPRETFFGDDFDVRGEDLGGEARAQSPLFGDIEVQFGRIAGGSLPFLLRLGVPSDAYEAKFENLMQLLPPGTRPGLVGMRGDLAFPAQSYEQRNLSLNSDPYKLSVGVIDVDTGRIRCCVLRKYLFQDLMLALLILEPRTPTDSFAYVCSGSFQAERGELALDLEGALHIPYPTGYKFPLPDGSATEAQEGSQLTPFLRFRALDHAAFAPMAGSGVNFVSSAHVRGRTADKLTFHAAPDAGERGMTVVELALDEIELKGRGPCPNQATYDDRQLTSGEFSLGAEGPVCTYYLTARGADADLQIVSADEELDLWFSGSANFA